MTWRLVGSTPDFACFRTHADTATSKLNTWNFSDLLALKLVLYSNLSYDAVDVPQLLVGTLGVKVHTDTYIATARVE